ncbi:uncharacterized protein LOC119672353 [Teleopsis dalmanni]|uniref:uncharacterized protein LOC119672353 n=1 Tax=Teleopsis dalmanni TaxID=139649 RepID=UPI0018CF6E16|nr:uncharacterized protein LOC119672353 [Teleopsis dalmanni]
MPDLWKQLADELNARRGPTRPVAKWKETLGVWKSQLRKRGRLSKMNQKLTEGWPSGKPLSDFEEKALNILGMGAVDSVKTIDNLGQMMSQEQAVQSLPHDCPISPSDCTLPSSQPSCSSVPSPSYVSSPSHVSSLVTAENQNDTNSAASISRLSQDERNKMINALIASIEMRNAADEERQQREEQQRQEHREVMQAIQGLTDIVTELVNVLKKNSNN